MLKRKLSKDEYDALPEGTKAFYKVDPGNANGFVLDVEPDTDNGALLRSKAAEKARADKAESDLAEANARIEELETAATAGNPDKAALEAAYKQKETALKAKHKAELDAKDKQLATILVDNKAMELAQKISTTPELIVDIIKKRLKPNLTDPENPTTDVLDAAGLATTSTIEDLGKELVANPKYGAIMIGSNGSGGGARPNLGGGGASYKGKKFEDTSEAERVAWHRDDPKGFKAASEASATKSAGL
jgi:hypothetical protein